MIPQTTQHEIAGHLNDLKKFLSAKYVDQSLILGFTTMIQGKFSKWISADVEHFKQLFDSVGELLQVDTSAFDLIELLQLVWSSFHHPIIKFYQRQHAELYALLVQSLKSPKRTFKVVEMRKLNANFTRLVTSIKAFYTTALSQFAMYPNSLVPSKFLQEFDISFPVQEKQTASVDLLSSLVYAMFYCLLELGNVSRHQAYIQTNYVKPIKSASAYRNHTQQKGYSAEDKKEYIFSLQCYSKCIGLLPTMHEPYNHIGVIYNSLGLKFSAALWFVRSQCTRDTSTGIGKYNLAQIFAKSWLDEAFETANKRPKHDVNDLNTYLLRVLSDHFYPQYRKTLYTKRLEISLLELMFKNEPRCSVVTEHLTVLFGFYALAEDKTTRSRFGAFLGKYLSDYLMATTGATPTDATLKNIRLILGFLRKSETFNGHLLVSAFAKVLNNLTSLASESDLALEIEMFVSETAPKRSHYFSEDIQFKDFTPIGCQFKDFNDNHMFKSGNLHLLFGLSHLPESEIPFYLDNDAVQRISKQRELGDVDINNVIATECGLYENSLRVKAILFMCKSVFQAKLYWIEEDKLFAYQADESEVKETKKLSKIEQPLKGAQSRGQKKSEPFGERSKPVNPPAALSKAAPKAIPSSIDEIELMILGHTYHIKPSEVGGETHLAHMVDAIVRDDGDSKPEDRSSKSGTTEGRVVHSVGSSSQSGGLSEILASTQESQQLNEARVQVQKTPLQHTTPQHTSVGVPINSQAMFQDVNEVPSSQTQPMLYGYMPNWQAEPFVYYQQGPLQGTPQYQMAAHPYQGQYPMPMTMPMHPGPHYAGPQYPGQMPMPRASQYAGPVPQTEPQEHTHMYPQYRSN